MPVEKFNIQKLITNEPPSRGQLTLNLYSSTKKLVFWLSGGNCMPFVERFRLCTVCYTKPLSWLESHMH